MTASPPSKTIPIPSGSPSGPIPSAKRQPATPPAPLNYHIPVYIYIHICGHGSKSRTPGKPPNSHIDRLNWVVHLPQNGTIGFDPQPYIYIYIYIYIWCPPPNVDLIYLYLIGQPSSRRETTRHKRQVAPTRESRLAAVVLPQCLPELREGRAHGVPSLSKLPRFPSGSQQKQTTFMFYPKSGSQKIQK